MPTYSRVLLSGSVSGKPISLAATATPGTLIHAAVAGAAAFDEIYLWVTNITGAVALLTIEWGGVTTADHLSTALNIPANSGPTLVAAGQVLNGGLTVRAFSSVAAALNISGFVSRNQ